MSTMYTIREIGAIIIKCATKDPTYSADDLTAAIYKAVDAASCEIVTYAKVRDFVAAVNEAIAIADGITLNPFYDSFRTNRLDPTIYGKYNTGVYFQLTGSTAVDLMGFAYFTPEKALGEFARVMSKQIADSSDFTSRPDDFHFHLVW